MPHLVLRKIASIALVGSVFLGTTTMAFATEPEPGPWLRLDTKHFTFFSAHDEASTRTLGHNLEALRGVLARLFPDATVDFAVPTYVYLCRDSDQFDRYQLPGVEAAGYFAPHPHANYAALDGDPARDPTGVVYKQYIAALLSANLPALPAWLTHGLAAYYSTFEFDGTEAKIGLPVRGYLAWLVDPGTVPRLDFIDLLSLPEPPRDNDGIRTFYPLAWGVVHYLLASESTRDRVPRLVQALAEGTPTTEAFERQLGLTLDELKTQVGEHLRADSFSYMRLQLPPAAPADMDASPLTAADTWFRLGDLLAHTAPTATARARDHFQTALRLDPEHALAHVGLGGLLDSASPEAQAHFAQAAARAPDDFLVQYLYGESLLASLGSRRPQTEEEQALVVAATTAYRNSTTLRPDYAEAWARLGYALGLAGSQAEEAVAALERALHGLPARRDVAFNLLLAYARVGARENAEAIVGRLARVGADDVELARAREVLLQMDYNQASQLIRDQQFDDAVAVLAHIQAETTSDALRARAADTITRIVIEDQDNHFAERYVEAFEHWRAGNFTGARAVLDALAPDARPGKQAEAVRALHDKLEVLQVPIEVPYESER